MTTTLRPFTPEAVGPDGARSREYAICVNGRPVGTARLLAPAGPSRVGRIEELTVNQGERGRGRGTVAALAAEEVLRGWDCTRVELGLAETPDTPAALRFAEALGYTVRSRNMVKDLPAEAPALPAGTSARPILDAEFPAWQAAGLAGYVQSLIGGGLSEDDARVEAEASHAALLPQGPHTQGTVLRVLEAEGERVGSLWVTLAGPDVLAGRRLAWVYEVEVPRAGGATAAR
ncbi:GNAT family N-acetyltransferase [Streptacidiphilus sp. EB129]|uniref:GNAT family N-acetyltransferase n=1 Tax=Streptacidiphilus sp. EB129 TaxID=3156262 RepID=UPI0035155A5A